jgi:hypothetical protein
MTAAIALPDALEKLGLCPASQWDMLRVLNHHHPVHLTRREMMLAAGFYEHVQGRTGAYACFEWAVLRLQRRAAPARLAARPDSNELYRLIKT